MAKCLIVGINDYGGENDLQGCVNDVRDVANTLSVINVTPPSSKSVRIRTDARATRKNILADLKWLTKGCQSGRDVGLLVLGTWFLPDRPPRRRGGWPGRVSCTA